MEVREHVLTVAKETLSRNPRSRVEPLLVGLAPDEVMTVRVLDLSLRMETLKALVREHGMEAFVLLYDGMMPTPDGGGRDALFLIWGSKYGVGGAEAHTYAADPLHGMVFGGVESSPSVAMSYQQVFTSPS